MRGFTEADGGTQYHLFKEKGSGSWIKKGGESIFSKRKRIIISMLKVMLK